MREISANEITQCVKELVIKANKILPDDLVSCIGCSKQKENNPTAKSILGDLEANIDAAKELDIPVCQDTGMAVIFAEIGQDVHITDGSFEGAVNKGIVNFVVQAVKNAGSNPCPPVVIGVGIGGDFEYSAILAKKALCRNVSSRNENSFYADMEAEMLEKINALDIGPQGFGGSTTALAVNIETYPTHIAGLPVAVNVGCHVTRHAFKEI